MPKEEEKKRKKMMKKEENSQRKRRTNVRMHEDMESRKAYDEMRPRKIEKEQGRKQPTLLPFVESTAQEPGVERRGKDKEE